MPKDPILVNISALQLRSTPMLSVRFADYVADHQRLMMECGARWNRTHSSWLLPLSKSNYQKLATLLKDKAAIDRTGLDKYLQSHPEATLPTSPGSNKLVTPQQWRVRQLAALPKQPPPNVPIHHHDVWLGLREYLMLQPLSVSTMRNYLSDFALYLVWLRNTPIAQTNHETVKHYMAATMETSGLRPSTANGRLSAIKKYYEGVLGQPPIYWEIPRAKKKFTLPNIMNEQEMRRMFAAVGNLKHKAILFTAYSAGLRVSDTVQLKLTDVDGNRMKLRIRNTNGGEDRLIGLGVLTLAVLRQYLSQCDPKPITFIFEGPNLGEPYSIASAQAIFRAARQRAGVNKRLTFHSLRHSFTTHLLEKGIEIRYIKDLLEQFNIKTSDRVLQVKKEKLITAYHPNDEWHRTMAWDS